MSTHSAADISGYEEDAAEIFVARQCGEWSAEQQSSFEARLNRDPAYADAYRRVEASWLALSTHAEAPEVMAHREGALAFARREGARRWLRPARIGQGRWPMAAGFTGAAVVLATAWQLSPFGWQPGTYRTGIGEQKMIELTDRSRVAADSATQLKVRYSNDARVIHLQRGQAQFTVAPDPARPFKVEVGDYIILALGTEFTVDCAEDAVRVAMMDGRVAVLPRFHAGKPEASPAPVELIAGDALRINPGSGAMLKSGADLMAALAWREGKVVFDAEPLGDAVRRMRRYSRLQVNIGDVELAVKSISGVFDAGDTEGFVAAVQRYYPITVHRREGVVTLQSR